MRIVARSAAGTVMPGARRRALCAFVGVLAGAFFSLVVLASSAAAQSSPISVSDANAAPSSSQLRTSPSWFAGASLSDNLSFASILAYDEGAVCGVFRRGSSRTPAFFAGAEVPMGSPVWSLTAKLQLSDFSTTLTTPAEATGSAPRAYRPSDGALVPIERERSFAAHLQFLSASALASYQLLPQFRIAAGPFAGFFTRHAYDETEQILSPSTAVYAENALTQRTISSGDLTSEKYQVHHLQAGVEVAATYDLTFRRNLILRPSLSAMIPVTAISGKSSSELRLYPVALSLSLVLPGASAPEPLIAATEPKTVSSWDSIISAMNAKSATEAKPHEENAASQAESREAKRPSALSVTIKAYGVADDGTEIAEPVLSVDRVHVTEIYPILHYVFFDDGSAAIPQRYAQRAPAEAAAFNEKTLYTANALEIHHHVLDVLGKRLKEHPLTSVTLLGTRSLRSPKDSLAGRTLSRSRAQSVAEYLHAVWGIAPERLKIRNRDLPEIASDDDNAFGEAENRRVEIVPSTPDITAPLWTERVERIATPPHIDFAPVIRTNNAVRSATIVVKQRERVLQTFNALTNGATGEYLWTLDNSSMPEERDSLTYTFTVQDSAGNTASASGVIHLRQELREKTMHAIDTAEQKQLERFSLIQFDYSSSQIEKKEAERILKEIAKAIDPNSSQVTLTGHTDQTGDDAFNDRLAEERVTHAAELVKEQLQRMGKDVPGMLVESHGSRDQLFDNSLPEGRVLSRTVRALIEQDADQDTKQDIKQDNQGKGGER